MVSTTDIAWLAGLLEGEGHFAKLGSALRIQVQMTDLDVIQRAARLLGVTNISHYPGRKPGYKDMYRASSSGITAASWMMTIYPLMGKRRQERIAEVLMVWRSLAVKRHNGAPIVHGTVSGYGTEQRRRVPHCQPCLDAMQESNRKALRRKEAFLA